MTNPGFAHFGSRLRTARKMAGMSLEDLAERTGRAVTRQALSKYEKGRMSPSPMVFKRISDALDLGLEREPAVDLCCSLREEVYPYGESGRHEATRFSAINANLDELPVKTPHDLRSPGDMAGLASRRRFLLRPPMDAASAPSPRIAPALVQVRFREREKLPVKTAVALRLRVEDYIRRCLEIESCLGVAQAFVNPLAGRAIKSVEDVETAAIDVRRAWGLGSCPIANLLGLLEEKGIRVFEVRGVAGFEGLSGSYGTVPLITVNRDYPDDRVRFTAAHELGHILCGFPEKEGAESLCHEFAGAFLLPRDALEKALMPARRKISLWELKELKESYGISLQAIIYRARSLGLVTGRQARTFRETIKAKGWQVTEPVEYRGNEQATRLRRLLSYAVAESIVAPERAAGLAGVSTTEFMTELGHIF